MINKKSALHKEGIVTVQVHERLNERGVIEIQIDALWVEYDTITIDGGNFTTRNLTDIGKAFVACAAIIESRRGIECPTPEACADAVVDIGEGCEACDDRH